MMQAIADCIYSLSSLIFMFAVYCGPLLNWYAFMAAMYESVWVAVLAFHLAAQASGYWVEAERWGSRYVQQVFIFACSLPRLLCLI